MLPQRLLVVILVIATVGAGAWWFLLRGDTPSPGNFVHQVQRFATAARAVPASADQVTSVTALRRWNKDVEAHLDEMNLAFARMVQIRSNSSDEGRRIVREALTTATQVIDLVGEYRDEVNTGALGPAASAADAIEALLTKLDARARAWKKL